MIPNDTKVWVIIFTNPPENMGFFMGHIKRVIATTIGKINSTEMCDYQAREQMVVFFRPDVAPWDKR